MRPGSGTGDRRRRPRVDSTAAHPNVDVSSSRRRDDEYTCRSISGATRQCEEGSHRRSHGNGASDGSDSTRAMEPSRRRAYLRISDGENRSRRSVDVNQMEMKGRDRLVSGERWRREDDERMWEEEKRYNRLSESHGAAGGGGRSNVDEVSRGMFTEAKELGDDSAPLWECSCVERGHVSSMEIAGIEGGGRIDLRCDADDEKNVCEESNMAFLPQDLLTRIFGALSYRDLSAATAVCRGWRMAAATLHEGMLFVMWGKLFRHGRRGVKKNEEKALDCFLKGAARGSAAAMVDAGLMLWERNRKLEALRWYREAAELGDAVGQCNYGLALQGGEAGKARPEEAVRWFWKSALAGNSRARYSLALCLQHGRGIAKDASQAVKWYLLTAAGGKNGAAKSMYNLALVYHFGEGVDKNRDEGRRWMMKAAFAGHSRAQFCYASQVKDQDPVRSLIFYELAAQGGETTAARRRDSLAQQLPPAWVERAYQAANEFNSTLKRV